MPGEPATHDASRRRFLAAGGALVVAFSLAPLSPLFAQKPGGGTRLPGSLQATGWIASIRFGVKANICCRY
jgi:hypothetical protein